MSHINHKKTSWFMLTDRCPYSGLPITCQKEFKNRAPASGFYADIAKIGNNIMLVKPYGYVDSSTGTELFAFFDSYIPGQFRPGNGIIYIEDYADITGADAEARKKYINFLKNKDIFIGVILFRLSPFFKIGFSLAKKLHIYSSHAHVVNTYEQAVDFALELMDQAGASQKTNYSHTVKTPKVEIRPTHTADRSEELRFYSRWFAKLKGLNIFFTKKAKQQLLDQYSEELLKHIASIDWKKPGHPPAKNIFQDGLSSTKVFDAISFIKSEIDTLMEERESAETVLKISETKHRLLVKHAKAGFMEYDYASNKIIGVNDELLKMTGYSEQELLRMSPAELLTEESRQLFLKRQAHVKAGETVSQDIVYQCKLKNGDIRWALLNTNINYRNNRPQKAIIVVSDITKLKNAEYQLLEYQQKLRQLSIRLSMIEEEQRRDMASYLHETIGQELFAMQLQLTAFEKSIDAPTLFPALKTIKDQLLKIIKETKKLTFDLSPPVLYDFGFKEALRTLSETVESKHNISVKTYFKGQMDKFDDEIKVILFRNVKELIHNTIKHADAQNITIRFQSLQSGLFVKITDDGVGFDVAKYKNKTASNGGFGLFDISEKLNHLGGRLTIDSTPGQGTSISMQVPILIHN